jgi:iron(III) transport system substrate-binding protein
VEKRSPQADIFWSNEFAQTLLLKEKGILSPYTPKNADSLPRSLVDAEGYWTGFGGRARILLINTDRIRASQAPKSILGLADGTTPADRVGISLPMFGTAATHAAALYATIGRDAAQAYYGRLSSSGARVVDGNSVVRDLVVSGELTYGMTDTDDACVAIQEGKPVEMVFLDQEPGGLGILLIPNTVAMIQGAPHTQQARQLLDYLASPETEAMLVQSGAIQVSARPGDFQNPCPIPDNIHYMDVDYEKTYQSLLQAQDDLREIFVK